MANSPGLRRKTSARALACAWSLSKPRVADPGPSLASPPAAYPHPSWPTQPPLTCPAPPSAGSSVPPVCPWAFSCVCPCACCPGCHCLFLYVPRGSSPSIPVPTRSRLSACSHVLLRLWVLVLGLLLRAQDGEKPWEGGTGRQERRGPGQSVCPGSRWVWGSRPAGWGQSRVPLPNEDLWGLGLRSSMGLQVVIGHTMSGPQPSP